MVCGGFPVEIVLRRPHGFEMTIQRHGVADQIQAVIPLGLGRIGVECANLDRLAEVDLWYKAETKGLIASYEMKQS
jgi:hypothetical protein